MILGGTTVDFDATQLERHCVRQDNVVAGTPWSSATCGRCRASSSRRRRRRCASIVAASLPQTAATITFDDGYPPLAPTAGNERLLAMYDQASRDLGLGPVAP